MTTFPLDALEAMDPLAGLKRAKRIAAHTSFLKSGICVGPTSVCVVKTSPLSSTIKIFEPIDQKVRGSAGCYRTGTALYRSTMSSTFPCNRARSTSLAQSCVWRA